MRIVVLDIAASKTGAMSVLRDFYGYISSTYGSAQGNGAHEWIFVTGVKDALCASADRNISIIVRDDVKASSKNRLIFDLVTGGRWINALKPDVVFSLQNTLPRSLGKEIRTCLYIHQPSGFQRVKNFSILKKDERHIANYQHFYHRLILASAKRADISIVQTEWMRDALIRDTGIAPERVRKIAPNITDLSGYVHPGEFKAQNFIYPASDLPYKNHILIEEAKKLLEKRGYAPRVRYSKDGKLPREELFAEYNSGTLLFPSYIETFGMPLAEARQFGNPILAADTEFAREVLDGYDNAYFFDAFDAGSLADLMMDVMDGRLGPKTAVAVNEDAGSYSAIAKLLTSATKYSLKQASEDEVKAVESGKG